MKDATADLNRVDQQLKKMGQFIQLSGEDGTAMNLIQGGEDVLALQQMLQQNFVLNFKMHL